MPWASYSTMADDANKEQADKCLDIAREALAAGALEKATRFGEKAMKLAPNDEVCVVLQLSCTAALLG